MPVVLYVYWMWRVYSSSQGCHTTTRTHMPHGITRCNLPPGRSDIPALTPAEAGTRLSDPGGMQGWVDLVTVCVYVVECGVCLRWRFVWHCSGQLHCGGVQSRHQLYNTGHQQDRRPVRLCHCHHSLRGSASPVLTATGFVSGRWQFLTPHQSTPLDWSPKNFCYWLCWRPLRLCQIWCKSIHWGASGHNIDIQAMWWWVMFWSVAVNTEDNLQFLVLIIM